MRQEYFEVSCDDGVIRGMTYVPQVSGRCPSVLLLHGFTGQRAEAGFMFVSLARALCLSGIAAVTFDFRHSGESSGKFDQMLVTGELDDCLVMTKWLQARLFADRTRLALLGFSLGGLLAACTSARTNAYRSLVLLAPTTVLNLCRYAGEDGAVGPITIGPHQLHPELFDDVRSLKPLNDITCNPRPTLLVHGSNDHAVPQSVVQEYASAMNDVDIPLTQKTIVDADHSFSKLHAREQLIETVTTWLHEQLFS